jgi:four helix bundle protein
MAAATTDNDTRTMTTASGAARPQGPPDFDLYRLDVYTAGLDFVELAFRCVSKLPFEYGVVADQLRRAALSIVLNTAEGAGELSAAEKRRFYRMARRSGYECIPLLDLLRRAGHLNKHDVESAYPLLARLIAMLTKLTRFRQQPAQPHP